MRRRFATMIQDSALAMVLSTSFVSLRQRPSQAKVRSTTHRRGNGLPEVWNGPCGGLSQECLELGEGILDRVEVGTIGRQMTGLMSLGHALFVGLGAYSVAWGASVHGWPPLVTWPMGVRHRGGGGGRHGHALLPLRPARLFLRDRDARLQRGGLLLGLGQRRARPLGRGSSCRPPRRIRC